MLRGLYNSALGMTVQMQKMDVVSNNIANVNTNGFKKDGVIIQSFSEELMQRLNEKDSAIARAVGQNNVGQYSQGLFIDDVYTDFSDGSLKRTDAPLDLAVTGNGFFTVSSGGTPVYTKDGSFTLSSDRVLITKEGNPVLGQNGVITVPDGNISIDGEGNLFVDAQFVDKLSVVGIDDMAALRKQGGELYTSVDAGAVGVFNGTVEQGFVESSNVNTVREMVELINITRSYEANQRMIQTHDTILGKAVTEIAKK